MTENAPSRDDLIHQVKKFPTFMEPGCSHIYAIFKFLLLETSSKILSPISAT
jgi:hypothetical protein